MCFGYMGYWHWRWCHDTNIDHASMSSKMMSAISSWSSVRSGVRGTLILSDLHTEGVVAVVPGTGVGSTWRRHGKAGSSAECGPGSTGRGLFIQLRGPLLEAREGVVGKSDSAYGHAHDISSSLVCSPYSSRSIRVNSSVVMELAVVSTC